MLASIANQKPRVVKKCFINVYEMFLNGGDVRVAQVKGTKLPVALRRMDLRALVLRALVLRALVLRALVLRALVFLLLGGSTAQAYAQSTKAPDFVLGPGLSSDQLTVYGSTDAWLVEPVFQAFVDQRAGLQVSYTELSSLDLHARVLSEAQDGVSADLVWSSAMGLQIKLVNDGFTQRVALERQDALPDWAHWRQEAFALSLEPVVTVYHKPSFAEQGALPTNRFALTETLKTRTDLLGKVATYDIERSGLGYLLIANDDRRSPATWPLISALASAQTRLQSSSSAMIRAVGEGRLALAYNVLGSYAQVVAEQEPSLGILYPEDYTLVISRLAVVPRTAKRPDLSVELLNFMLSDAGQALLTQRSHFLPVLGANGQSSEFLLQAQAKRTNWEPIRVGPALLSYLDQSKKESLIRQWRKTLQGPR